MKLTVDQVLNATPILTRIINEKRALPLKGAYRVARMHAKLVPEFQILVQRRDAMIGAYGHLVWIDNDGEEVNEAEALMTAFTRQVPGVPADKKDEFRAICAELGAETIEVDVEPIPLSQLDLGDDVAASITALELVALGDLVLDDAVLLHEAKAA